jgi:hypothetical protein
LDVDTEMYSEVQIDSKGYLDRLFQKMGSSPPISHALNSIILRSAQKRFLLNPPCSVASFEVNSEPLTEARPSVRLCVELIKGSIK